MAPTTPFEDSGGAEWTGLDAEQAFLETIAAETAATLTTAGESVQGRPLWRMDLGDGDANTLLVVAMQHSNEKAAREAALQWVRDLAYSADPVITTYLTGHRVVVMPDCNPDGFALDQRHNANNVDINRDIFALTQPEARALQDVINDTSPHLVIDVHEQNFDPSVDMLYRRPELVCLYEGIGTKGDELIAALVPDFDAAGMTHGLYPIPGRVSFRESAGLHHALGFLIETYTSGVPTERVSHQLVALQGVRDWHDGEAASLTTMAADSRTYQATTTDQYILQTSHIDFPWPQTPLPTDLKAYLVHGLLPVAFDAYGVTVVGDQVPLSQEARAVIPILLDQASDDQLIDADRLTTFTPPITVATVQELAPIVAGSHRAVFSARVCTLFQSSNNPAGTEIDIISGDVTYDATAEVFGTLELETPGLDEARRSRFPRRAGDLLAPYGNEVFVRRGIDIGSEILWVPLGYFRIDDAEQPGASDSPIRISGSDRMAGIIDADRTAPYQYGPTVTVGTVVSHIVTEVYPDAVITFDDSTDEQEIGRTIIVEESRYDALLDLVESLGKVMFWDGSGILRIEDPPDPTEIVMEIRAGHHGVLVESGRRVSREGIHNAVVAQGEGASERPVRAVAFDRGPQSPTNYFDSRFGRRPRFYTSPLLTTRQQCEAAAMSMLRRYIGMPYSADFGAIVNPALRPRAMVRVTQKDGNREKHIVDTLTIPLVPDAHMTGTTREQTRAVIGLLAE